MTYKVYSGPAGTDAVSPVDKDRMLFKEFPNLDEALSWASHIKATGRVAFLIEGDGGTRFDKREIAAELAHREAQVAGGVSTALGGVKLNANP